MPDAVSHPFDAIENLALIRSDGRGSPHAEHDLRLDFGLHQGAERATKARSHIFIRLVVDKGPNGLVDSEQGPHVLVRESDLAAHRLPALPHSRFVNEPRDSVRVVHREAQTERGHRRKLKALVLCFQDSGGHPAEIIGRALHGAS
jgi:hypothetical protein